MRIIKKKQAAKFNELYDFIDDDTIEQLNDYGTNNFDTIDYDALERGEVPVIEVDDDGIESILTDNLDETQMQEPIIEEPELELEPEEEIAIEGEDVPDFASPQEAMQWAIDNNRVVKIFYTTKGEKRGRGGKQYLLREKGLIKGPVGGVSIYRIVEPHYMFQAKNGNLILVTYDRSVRYIRAFIVDNITDYNFTKNRKTKEPQYFKPRVRIIPKQEKGIKVMEKINENLIKLASEIEEKGMLKSASIVRDAKKALEELKTAQYVGVQGYWIRNRRCWDNCYRHKRTSQPKTPAQEVWMECWAEYNKSINDDKSGWEKYATEKTNIKLSEKDEVKWNKSFISKVENKAKEGFSTPEAIYATIEEEEERHFDKVLNSSSELMSIAETFNNNNMKDLGKKLADVSVEMLKEADFGNRPTSAWEKIKSPFERGGRWLADKWTGKGNKNDVVERIQDVINRANQLLMNLNLPPQTASSKEKIIIEAGKGTRVVKEGQRKRGTRGQWMSNKDIMSDDLAYEQGQSDLSQQSIDQAESEYQPPVPSQPAQPAQPSVQQPAQQPTQQTNYTKQYMDFIKDTSKLVGEFSKTVTSTKDPDVSRYISQVNPILQGFIGESTELRRLPDPSARRESLRDSLQKLVNNLQGVLLQQDGDLNNNRILDSEEVGVGQTAQPSQVAPSQAVPSQVSPSVTQQGLSTLQLSGDPNKDAQRMMEDMQLRDYFNSVIKAYKTQLGNI